jgi:prepilin-type N-terminal cleavage/methylation domain-containing protein
MAVNYRSHSQDRGFSLMEILVAIAIFGILTASVVSNISILENPLINVSANLSHYIRLVRARAISQTRSIKITPVSNRLLTAASAQNCDEVSFDAEPDLTLDLGDDVTLASTSWTACFTQRGLADDYVTFSLATAEATKVVEIALGGGIRID